MLYRNGGLSELLFKQYIIPIFTVVKFKAGSHIPTNNCLYIILDGTADAKVTLIQRSDISTSSSNSGYSCRQSSNGSGNGNGIGSSDTMSSKRPSMLCSGDIMNIKHLHMFRNGSKAAAFANQTVDAYAKTNMTCYCINSNNIYKLANTGQLKNAYQGILRAAFKL
jgi:hypothetical protein